MKKITLFLLLLSALVVSAQPVYVNIVFGVASATSDSFYVPSGYTLSGILLPASFTDTLTFQSSVNGGKAFVLNILITNND